MDIRSNGKSVLIDHVKHNSPAQQAGVRGGDVLISMNGQMVKTMSTAEVANVLVGAQAAIGIGAAHHCENGKQQHMR